MKKLLIWALALWTSFGASADTIGESALRQVINGLAEKAYPGNSLKSANRTESIIQSARDFDMPMNADLFQVAFEAGLVLHKGNLVEALSYAANVVLLRGGDSQLYKVAFNQAKVLGIVNEDVLYKIEGFSSSGAQVDVTREYIGLATNAATLVRAMNISEAVSHRQAKAQMTCPSLFN